MRRRGSLLLVLAAAGGLCVTSGSGPADDSFEELFGDEARDVRRTSSGKDDAAFAEKLLAAGDKVADDPGFQSLLYEKAYEVSSRHPYAYDVAVEALGRLIEASPDRTDEFRRKLAELHERRYRYARGAKRLSVARDVLAVWREEARARMDAREYGEAVDAYRRALRIAGALRLPEAEGLTERIKSAVAAERMARQRGALLRALEADPDNALAARKLMMLDLVEGDDPAAAAKLLDRADVDTATRKNVVLATKPWHAVGEDNALKLAAWYEGLAGGASEHGRPKMLARARGYFKTYIALHGVSDAAALQAKLGLQRVEKQLARLDVPLTAFRGPPRDVSGDILKWIPHRDSLSGEAQYREVLKKLSEANGKPIKAREHEVRDGKLVMISFWENKDLANIGPLYGLRLTGLHIGATKVTCIEPLRGMPLEELGLSELPITNLHGLEGMPLRQLRLDWGKVRSLEALRGAPLEELYMDGLRELSSLVGLEGAPLRKLNAYDAYKIRTLDPLRRAKLTSVHLRFAFALEDISALRGQPLGYLNIRGSKVRDLSPLRGAPIKKLVLGQCKKLASLEPILGLPLETLEIDSTKFANERTATDLKRRIPTLKEVKIE